MLHNVLYLLYIHSRAIIGVFFGLLSSGFRMIFVNIFSTLQFSEVWVPVFSELGVPVLVIM